MPLHASDYAPGTPVSSFVDSATGENTHIDSVKLREWALRTGPEIMLVPVQLTLAFTFLRDNVVLPDRVAELHNRYKRSGKLEPIIFGLLGQPIKQSPWKVEIPDALLIDGHHRYVVAAVNRMSLIPGFMVPERDWRQFQILGLPDMSADQLRQAPVNPNRNY